jgi:hypothetical protein
LGPTCFDDSSRFKVSAWWWENDFDYFLCSSGRNIWIGPENDGCDDVGGGTVNAFSFGEGNIRESWKRCDRLSLSGVCTRGTGRFNCMRGNARTNSWGCRWLRLRMCTWRTREDRSTGLVEMVPCENAFLL